MSYRTIELGDREGAENLELPVTRRNGDLRGEVAEGVIGYQNGEFWPIPAKKEIRTPIQRAVPQHIQPDMSIKAADQLPGEAAQRREIRNEKGFGLSGLRRMLRPWGPRR